MCGVSSSIPKRLISTNLFILTCSLSTSSLCYISRFLYHASTSSYLALTVSCQICLCLPFDSVSCGWVLCHLFHYCPSYSSPSIPLTQQMKSHGWWFPFVPSSDRCIEQCDLTPVVRFIFCQSTTELVFEPSNKNISLPLPRPAILDMQLGRGDSYSLVSNL